jgi:hypothetical protein
MTAGAGISPSGITWNASIEPSLVSSVTVLSFSFSAMALHSFVITP